MPHLTLIPAGKLNSTCCVCLGLLKSHPRRCWGLRLIYNREQTTLALRLLSSDYGKGQVWEDSV